MPTTEIGVEELNDGVMGIIDLMAVAVSSKSEADT